MSRRFCRTLPHGLSTWRVAAAMAAFVLLSGCVSTAFYPSHWAEQVKVERGTCPDINGEYLNEGESFEKVGDGGIVRHTASLGGLACSACTESERSAPESFAPLTEEYERFRLEITDGTLKITAKTADGAGYAYERPIRAQCSGSLMQVEAGWLSSLEEEGGWEVFGSTLGMSLLEHASLKMGRAEDGSLLVRQSGFASLMVLEWPVLPMSATAWIRFPAATPPREPDDPLVPPAVQAQLQAGMPP